jgi:DNA-binding CsgD family transcriptional regulator
MSPPVIMTAIGLAVISAPSAFLFLWLTYKRTGELSFRSLAFCLLGLFFMLSGNAVNYVLFDFLHHWDSRVQFLILNEVFLAAVITSGFLLRFAYESVRTRITSSKRVVFWAVSILFFFLVLSVPILSIPNAVDIAGGYLASTLYAAVCQFYATFIIIKGRAKLPQFFRFLPAFCLGFAVLNVLAILNDTFRFGALLGVPAFPLSPFSLFLSDLFIVYGCIRGLLKKNEGTPALPGGLDFDLSDRESEIVPLIVEGLSNEAIAAKLFISPHTVKNHVTSIFRKSGATNRFELLKRISAGKAS